MHGSVAAPTVSTVAFALCGAVVGLGVWVGLGGVLGWRVVAPGAAAGSDARQVVGSALPERPWRSGLALSIVTGLATGAAAAAALGVPVLIILGAGTALVAAEAARGPSVPAVNALGAGVASWCETVRQDLDAGQPLRAALVAACDSPPAGLEESLGRLAARLEAAPVPEALWAFASEVRHPAAGQVVAALDVAYRLGAGDLPRLMAGQVETTRHQVQMLREVHAARAKHRRAMILVLVLFGVVIGGLFVLWPDFLAAYRSAQGQLVLAGIGGAVLLAVRALIRLGQPDLPPDFFGTGPRAGQPASAQGWSS